MGVWTWHVDVLAHECVACPCRCRWRMGDVDALRADVDEGKEKEKERPVVQEWWTWAHESVRIHCGCVQMHMSGEKKRRKTNLLMGLGWTCRGTGMWVAALVFGCGCVACGCRWVERKKKKKELTLSMRMVDMLACSRVAVKTGSSRLGTDKGGKCDSIGLSAACPSKVATIRSVVVVVMWAKADQFREWLRVLSCVLQQWVVVGQGNPKGSGSGKDREKTEDRDTGSILVDYQTEELETRVRLLILRAEREMYRDRIGIGDHMYGEEQSM